MEGILHFDGACLPTNPGVSCYGYVLGSGLSGNGVVSERGGTSNEAEYTGLIRGLEAAAGAGVSRLSVFGDSQLVIFQVTEKWRCRDIKMARLRAQAQSLLEKFEWTSLRWIPREHNAVADHQTRLAYAHHLEAGAKKRAFEVRNVIPLGCGLFEVSGNGGRYEVNLSSSTCSCECFVRWNFQHATDGLDQPIRCKHVFGALNRISAAA